MKNKTEFNEEKSSYLQTPETAIRSLRNFCTSYTFRKSDELLCRSLTALIGGNYTGLSNFTKEQLMDYFEALEEVLPALYELQEHLNKPVEPEEDEETYRDEVSAKHIYASFKRHPE